MEKINSWCRIIALISFLSSVIFLIIPESKIKKAFKILLSLIMIYAFVSPLSNNEVDFSFTDNYFGDISSEAENEIINEYKYYPVVEAGETELENYFNDILLKFGTKCQCEVNCEYDGEKLLLKEVIIYGSLSEDEKTVITDEVRKTGDEETIISFSGEEYG